MINLKNEAISAISLLPETANMEEILHRLQVLDKVCKGMEAVKNGDTISVEELKRDMLTW